MKATDRIGFRLLQALTLAVTLGVTGLAQTEQTVTKAPTQTVQPQQRPVSQNPTQATQAKPPTQPAKPLLLPTATVDRGVTLTTGTLGISTQAGTITTQPAPQPAPSLPGGTSTTSSVRLIAVQPLTTTRPTPTATPSPVLPAPSGMIIIDGGGLPPARVPGAPTPAGMLIIDSGKSPAPLPPPVSYVIQAGSSPGAAPLPAAAGQTPDRLADAGRLAGVPNGAQPTNVSSQMVVITEIPARSSVAPGAGATSYTDSSATAARTSSAATGATEMRERADDLSTVPAASNPGAHLGLAQISAAQRSGEEAAKRGLLATLRAAIMRRRETADAATSRTAVVRPPETRGAIEEASATGPSDAAMHAIADVAVAPQTEDAGAAIASPAPVARPGRALLVRTSASSTPAQPDGLATGIVGTVVGTSPSGRSLATMAAAGGIVAFSIFALVVAMRRRAETEAPVSVATPTSADGSTADETLDEFCARLEREDAERGLDVQSTPAEEAAPDATPPSPDTTSAPPDAVADDGASAPSDEDLAKIVAEALQAGTPEALGLAVLLVGIDDPRAEVLLQRLEQLVSAGEAAEYAKKLEAITSGTLDRLQLDSIAHDAYKQGHLTPFVAASLAALDQSQSPAEKAARLTGLVAALRAVLDGTLPPPDAPDLTPEDQERLQSPVADLSLSIMQRRARALLDSLKPRVDSVLAALDGEIDQALEDAGRAGAALGEEPGEHALLARQAAIDSARALSRLRAGLTLAGLDKDARTAALQKLLQQAADERDNYARRIAGRDDWPAADRERALGRLNALRAVADAVEDLLIDSGEISEDAAVDAIFWQLNGRNGNAGLRQQFDEAQQRGDAGESRRLQHRVDYLEDRRLAILSRTSGADAIGKLKKIKQLEASFWQSRPGAQSGRILDAIAASRAQLIPAALGSIRAALDEQGVNPAAAAQEWIRALAQITADDVEAGRRQWVESKSRPWYERGFIVGNNRLWNSDAIEYDILEDRRYAESLRLAGDTPATDLFARHRGAYARLVQKGLIKKGEYAIPDRYAYSPDTAGSRYGTPHWLDNLNARQFGEIIATVLAPAGAAAHVTRGIKAGAAASRALKNAVWGTQLAAEAGAFTLFSRGAQRALYGVRPDDRSVAADFVSNLAIIGGLRGFQKLFQGPERALFGKAAAGGNTLTPAQTDAAIRRMLWNTASKPMRQLTWTDAGRLGTKVGLESVKAGAEAGAFTAFNALPLVGHGGSLDWESYRDNLMFVGQLRGLHVTGAYGATRVTKALSRPRANGTETRPDALIAEPGESAAGLTARARFTNWYRSVATRVPIADVAQLSQYLQRQFQHIADNPPWSKEKREAARSIALLMQSGRVTIEFTKNAVPHRGNYDPVTRTAYIHVDPIIVGLYNRMVQTRGRQPKVGEVVDSLLGTTAHEALEHGLQGVDVPPETVKGGAIPNPPRAYSKLHEARAYWVQRLFDPTLGGKNRGYRRGTAVKLKDVIETVARNYGDLQGPNRKVLRDFHPDRLPQWDAAEARIEAALKKKLRMIERRQFTDKTRNALIARVVARARAARAAAMADIFRTFPAAPVAGTATRLRQVRQDLHRIASRLLSQAQANAAENVPLPAAAELTLRRLIRGLGIEWKAGEEFGDAQQTALRNRLVEQFRTLSTDRRASEQVRDAAGELALLLEGDRVRTQWLDNENGGPLGAYYPGARIAEIYLRTIAYTAEHMTRKLTGRRATSADFLRLLMGTTAHEVLEHGFRQQLGLRKEGKAPILGTRPRSRLHEMSAFLTEQLFEPTLGGILEHIPDNMVDTVMRLVRANYTRRTFRQNNEVLLVKIDNTVGENWLAFRRRLDRYFSGRETGADARRALIESLEALPVSAEQRRQFDRLLREREAPPRVVEFDPTRESMETRASSDPILTIDMLKEGMLADLIFTRTQRVGSEGAHITRRAINRLRSGRQPLWPELPEPPEAVEKRLKRKARKQEVRKRYARERRGGMYSFLRRETPLAGERRLLRRQAIADRGSTPLKYRTEEVDLALARLDGLLDKARADGVTDAALTRLLRLIRESGVRLDDRFMPRVDTMLKVARANARGATFIVATGDAALEAFHALCWFVRPHRVQQLNLHDLWSVKAKAALEGRTPLELQRWTDDEIAVARQVAAAGDVAFGWMEWSLELSDGRGFSQLFQPEDIANIRAAVARRAEQGAGQ